MNKADQANKIKLLDTKNGQQGDITNNSDAQRIESKTNNKKKRIIKVTLITVLIIGIILAIVLPLTLLNPSKPINPVDPVDPVDPTNPWNLFNGTDCIDGAQIDYLQTLLSGSAKKKFNSTLLFKSSLHGQDAPDFHSRCDNVSSTVTVTKLTNGISIAAYTSLPWCATD